MYSLAEVIEVETAYWHSAREGRERKAMRERTPNIFKGGSKLEAARIGTVDALRLSIWPAGAKAPPFRMLSIRF